MAAVSVIVPTKDRCELLHRCLASVDKQTLRPYEVIVVDDGSKNKVEVKEFSSLGCKIRIERLEFPTNAANARNIGIDLASGGFLAFLDSDDYWLPCHLEHAVAAIKAQEVEFVFGDFMAASEQGKVWPANIKVPEVPVDAASYLAEHGGTIRTSTFVGRRKFVRDIKFDSALEKHQDWDFALRAAVAGRVGFKEKRSVYIDHAPACRMSGAANPVASSYFLRKHRAALTDIQWRRLLRRIIKGASQVSDVEACLYLNREFRNALSVNDNLFCKLCAFAAKYPRPVRVLRDTWRLRHRLK